MRYVEKIDVIEKDGTRTRVKAYEYEALNDGYFYFYGPGITKRVPVNNVQKMIFYGRSTGAITKVITFVVSSVTIRLTKDVFSDYIYRKYPCTSNNPIIKGCWDIAAKIAAFGASCVANQIVSTSVENVIVPFTDGMKLGYEESMKLWKQMKGETTNEVQEIKEVFEESETNDN